VVEESGKERLGNEGYDKEMEGTCRGENLPVNEAMTRKLGDNKNKYLLPNSFPIEV
jgi:hypothetical protein